MRWMALCLVFMVLYSKRGIDVSMISFFAFVANLSPYMSTFFSFLYDLWYCGWLHMTCLGLRWIPSDFTHKASMNSLVKSLWDDLFSPSSFFCQTVMYICWALYLRSVDKEFIWNMKRFMFILLETFVMMCYFFLITMFATACFIWHFSSLMQPWYWGIPPSLRLSSLG